MKSKTILSTVMAWFIFIILSLLILNNSIFLHVHKLDNGKIVTHAHPFNKTEKSSNGAAKHKHSQQEIYIYQILNNLMILGICLITLGTVFRFINDIRRYFYEYFHPALTYQTLKVRPPPTA